MPRMESGRVGEWEWAKDRSLRGFDYGVVEIGRTDTTRPSLESEREGVVFGGVPDCGRQDTAHPTL